MTEFASAVGVVVDRHPPASRLLNPECVGADLTSIVEGLDPDVHNDLLLHVAADEMRGALSNLVSGTLRG